MSESLGLSFHTVKQLNNFIDNKLPGRPSFQCQEMVIGQERLDFYYRDVLECIRSLFGDPQYVQDLIFAPAQHYTTHERKSRLYHEMYTCDWWWTIQVLFDLQFLIRSFTDWVERNRSKRASQGL